MILRKLIDIIREEGRDIQERLMLLVCTISTATLLCVFLLGVIFKENPTSLLMSGFGFALSVVIMYFCIKYNKIRLGAIIGGFLIVTVILPLTFFASGSIMGGAPVWFVFGAIFVFMTVHGKMRIVLLIVHFIVMAASYFIAYRYPDLITEHTVLFGYQDSFMSASLVSLVVGLMFEFSIRTFREENRRSENQRKEIDELNRAQNRFFSTMSHEIRTPINSIIGLNEMILREDISDEVKEDALNIQSASKLLLHIINDILDMSKIESGEMELKPAAYEVETMLSDLVSMIWIRAQEKALQFYVDVDPMLPAVLYGDELRIKQILINILTNAVKYTKEGSVTLSIQLEQKNDDQVNVIYTVSDTGIGIKKESIPYLFTAFKRVDTAENRHIEGTGLGLAIVKQFTELMNGSIKVNSVYMQGTTFVVEIPQRRVTDRNIGKLNLEQRHHQQVINRRAGDYHRVFEAPDAKILVVDDNSVNLLVVKKLLRDTKALISTAESGEEALQKTLADHYDLIFMDHLMPEMDGIECFHKLREQTGGQCKDSKVCVLTANAGSDHKAMYQSEGFDGCLVKPVSGRELEDEVLRLLPRQLVHILNEEASLSENLMIWQRGHHRKLPLLITTDSVCDLPREFLQTRRDILAVLPYHVCTEQGDFLDEIETESRGLITYMLSEGGTVRSVSPSVEEYEEFFSARLREANNIIHITTASGVSSGYANASDAARTFENVTVFNSGNVSSGMGFLVMEAVRMAREDQPADLILQTLQEMRSRIRTTFIVENTDYLARARRINPIVSKLTKAFMLHPLPVLTVKKDKMSVERICFGTKEKAWKKYITTAFNTTRPVDTSLLFITSAGLSQTELEEIEKEVRKNVSFEKIIFQNASSAISVNCGPGAFGLLFKTIS
ncbi:MAG: DegV family EDD domain-containing protein [Lachnospiraceae bacterium]|nr:DegV family EDD domain-containing protein [Lachnospiraceae bacterium]